MRHFLILLWAMIPLSAQSENTDVWQIGVDSTGNKFHYASTENSSKHYFGIYCYFSSGDCVYLIAPGSTCTSGNEYPAIINSDAGSVAVDIVCMGESESGMVFAVSPFDDVELVVRKASMIGIVIPMEDGAFQVSRFSLAGAVRQIDSMVEIFIKRFESNKTGGLPSEEFL